MVCEAVWQFLLRGKVVVEDLFEDGVVFGVEPVAFGDLSYLYSQVLVLVSLLASLACEDNHGGRLAKLTFCSTKRKFSAGFMPSTYLSGRLFSICKVVSM